MNVVVIIGRPVRDPEMRVLPNSETAVTKFTLAVDRQFKKDGKKEADFIPVVVFGKSAEFVANNVVKGKLCAVKGRIQTGSYEKDGKKVYTTDIIAEDVKPLEWREKSDFNPAAPEDSESIPF